MQSYLILSQTCQNSALWKYPVEHCAASLLIMAFFLSAFRGKTMVLHGFLDVMFLPPANMKDVCTLEPLAPER